MALARGSCLHRTQDQPPPLSPWRAPGSWGCAQAPARPECAGTGWWERGDAVKPSPHGQRGPFVSMSLSAREEQPPLTRMRLISTGGCAGGAMDPSPAQVGWDALCVPGAGQGGPGFRGDRAPQCGGTGAGTHAQTGDVLHPMESLAPPTLTVPEWDVTVSLPRALPAFPNDLGQSPCLPRLSLAFEKTH